MKRLCNLTLKEEKKSFILIFKNTLNIVIITPFFACIWNLKFERETTLTSGILKPNYFFARPF